MLTLSDRFIQESELNNPNRVVLIKMFYDDSSSFSAFASRTTVVDNIQYLGAAVSFNAPKSQWNILSNNNVTVSSPTLSIANIQGFDGSNFLDDSLYSSNYLGRDVEIYIGYQGMGVLSDYALIYKGKIDDYNFQDGKITIKFKTTEFHDFKINGKEFDYENNMVGDINIGYMDENILVSGVHEDAKSKCVPIVFGNQWNSPLVLFQNYKKNEDYVLAVQDTSSSFYDYSNILQENFNTNLGMDSKIIYVEDEDMLVPVGTTSPSAGDDRWSGEEDTSLEMYKITINNSSDDFAGDGTLNLITPMRWKSADVVANTIIHSGTGGSVVVTENNTSEECVDLNESTSWDFTFTGARWCNTDPYNYWYDSYTIDYWQYETMQKSDYDTFVGDDYYTLTVGWNPVLLDWKWNLRGRGEYEVTIHERPIHLPENNDSEGLGIGTRVYAYITGTNNTAYSRGVFLTNIVDKNDEEIGWAHVGQQDAYGNEFPRGRSFSTDIKNLLYNYDGLNNTVLLDSYTPHSLMPITHEHPFGNTDFKPISEEQYDAFLAQRATWDAYKVGFKAMLFADTSVQETVNLKEVVLAHNGSVDLSNKMFAEVNAVKVNDIDDMHSITTAELSLTRPYHYIEAILRDKGGAEDSDFNTSEWVDIETKWDNLYDTSRDYSGFVITEPTKFKDFISKYLKDELFTVYKNELGKYSIPCLQQTYDNDDVDFTVSYNDTDTFEMGITPLNNVVSDIGTLSTDRIYFNKSYAAVSTYHISDGDYDYDFYDAENDYSVGRFSKESLEKEYTSFSKEQIVKILTVLTYKCLQTNIATVGLNDYGSPNFDDCWESVIYNPFTIPWVEGETYSPISMENYAIGKTYLNQFGNRHRTVKFSTRDMSYYKLQIGDVIKFQDVPSTLLGMEIEGFGSNSHDSTATINGQTVYAYFIITSVSKNLDKIEIECMQLHNLNSLEVSRGRQ